MTPSVTRVLLRAICTVLRGVRRLSQYLHDALPDPLDAEDMGEGRIPESPEFALRGDIECLVADYLSPGIRLLERSSKGGE